MLYCIHAVVVSDSWFGHETHGLRKMSTTKSRQIMVYISFQRPNRLHHKLKHRERRDKKHSTITGFTHQRQDDTIQSAHLVALPDLEIEKANKQY